MRIPQWQTLAAISVVLASLLLGLLYVHSRTLGTRGRSLLAIVVYAPRPRAVLDHLRLFAAVPHADAAC